MLFLDASASVTFIINKLFFYKFMLTFLNKNSHF